MRAKREYLQQNDASIGVYHIQQDSFVPYWHYHPEIELTLIKKGQGLRFIGDAVTTFEEGDVVLIEPDVPHQWVSSKEVIEVEAIVVHFNQEHFKSIPELNQLLTSFISKGSGISFLNIYQSISPLFSQLLVKKESYLRLTDLVLILHHLKSAESEAIPYMLSRDINLQGNDRLDKIHQYIFQKYSSTIRIDEIASIVNMTKTSFCRWFKHVKGISFIHYLHQFRIEQACHLIKHSDLSISEICYEVGFESLSQFNRTFKQIKECSPSTFRKYIHKE
ncbi:AraC family transcriptional regulator [Flammeovirga agarivorans]|uniref:AraC family transcriptional regulator n=1 Tax=Flammeovirga agarivorans TaxID=2726742 RepID=A0A7X8SKT4_9BACT|nr:AraC family transcriptional regulator [Flammeovirga agarivorans]NLR92079.1 AraC family transcriptional regulator [Flammeovirga agarivorans]